jgi:SAM-dependent methyltransferase
MSFLNQSRFPTLWKLFQYVIGGSCHKRQLARLRYSGAIHVLEVGCSVGNLAEGFVTYPAIRYTGVDIDASAIRNAQRAFRRRPNFRFLCGNLWALALPPGSFDYIILSAMLHHVEDGECRALLTTSAGLLSNRGKIIVTDPLLPELSDPWLVRFFDRIEQGQFVRSHEQLLGFLSAVPGLAVQEQHQLFLTGSPFGWPRIARCGFYHLGRAPALQAADEEMEQEAA